MEKNYTAIIAGIVAFIIGLLIGTGITGDGNKKDNEVKTLLNQALQGIDQMEQENRNLRADLENVKKGKTARENKSLKENISKIKDENEKLKQQVSKLEGHVAHTKLQLEARDDQSSRIAELKKENMRISELLEKIKTISKGGKASPDTPSKEITVPLHEK
jgi:predicted RNase H-like nuclease (RuvC/YqgF family)